MTTRSSFPGGVHPAAHKALAAEAATEVLPTPDEIHVPLVQHLGAPCKPGVEPRAEVALGDELGNSDAFVSAPIHASISGTVGKLTAVTLPNGCRVRAIPVKASDEQPLSGQDLFDDIFGGPWPTGRFEQYEPKQIVDACRAGGLVGLGGAAFPTHVKLVRNEKRPIDTLLINGCECEPYLTADDRLMVEAPAPVVTGALLAQRATGAESVKICIEDNKPKALESLRRVAGAAGVEVLAVKTKYPQGGERQLVAAVLKREVPIGGLPLDVGAVVVNVGTAAALARAVLRGKPLTHRIVTVTGAGIRRPRNLLVPIGAAYRLLIDYCGGVTEDAARIVSGGPMMGFTLGNLDTPVTKGTSGVTVLTHDEVRKAKETACVRCGRCVDVCPVHLVPTKIALASKAGDLDLAQRYCIAGCIECGCCAYVCPASVPLVQLIRLGKVLLQKAASAKKN